MKKGLTWRVIAELHALYCNGEIKAKDYVLKNSYVKHLESFHYIEVARKNRITATPTFKKHYEEEDLSNYQKYYQFLTENELLDPHWNFKEEDIQTLIVIHANRDKIVESGQTKNQISSFYFRHEDAKYVRKSISLSNAILKLTGLSKFPEDEKDQQYMISIPCKRPVAILLCENMDKVRMPKKFQAANIELWYAGGRNISKLANIRENETLPFWYCCDWDYDGLNIYQSIKHSYIPRIRLVVPQDWESARKPIGNHKSLWARITEADRAGFSELENSIVDHLIAHDEWIEEESFTFDLQRLC